MIQNVSVWMNRIDTRLPTSIQFLIFIFSVFTECISFINLSIYPLESSSQSKNFSQNIKHNYKAFSISRYRIRPSEWLPAEDILIHQCTDIHTNGHGERRVYKRATHCIHPLTGQRAAARWPGEPNFENGKLVCPVSPLFIP